jgi:hypothetical protein
MTTTTTTVTPPDIQPVGLIQTPMHTLLTELVLLCVLLGAAFWAGLGQGNPCNTVYNQVSYPGGVVRHRRCCLWLKGTSSP